MFDKDPGTGDIGHLCEKNEKKSLAEKLRKKRKDAMNEFNSYVEFLAKKKMESIEQKLNGESGRRSSSSKINWIEIFDIREDRESCKDGSKGLLDTFGDLITETKKKIIEELREGGCKVEDKNSLIEISWEEEK